MKLATLLLPDVLSNVQENILVWQSLTTPAIISSAALSYWHHKTVIIKLYHTFQV